MEKGDWVFHEFTLGRIEEITDGKITKFVNGSFQVGGNSLFVLPLTLVNKSISEQYDYYWREIRELKCGLNLPDIHRHLVKLWIDDCSLPVNSEHYIKVREFYQEIRSAVLDKRLIQVQTVKVFDN